MAEYIDREKAKRNLVQDYAYAAASLLDEVPKSDVSQVVRCKDCKQWGGVTFGNVCRRWSVPLSGMKNCTRPDDFCSYGERKEDDGKSEIVWYDPQGDSK